MSTLNYLCKHDVSDEDCYKCTKHGILFRCLDHCKDFEDVRKQMSQQELEARAKLMEQFGLKDRLPWEDK